MRSKKPTELVYRYVELSKSKIAKLACFSEHG